MSGSTSSDLSGLEGLVNAAAANAHDPNNYYAVHAHHHHQHHHGMHQVHHPHHGYSSANNVNFQLWSFFELFPRKSISCSLDPTTKLRSMNLLSYELSNQFEQVLVVYLLLFVFMETICIVNEIWDWLLDLIIHCI